MKIGLNAHLLSGRAGYRSAGIHAYISNLLRNLPALAPAGWQFEALVGGANRASFPGLRMARARLDTEQPWRRILWEQALQPWQLRRYDLYHALAFVAPIVLSAPMVVTIYDLSFLRYPERLSAARRIYLRALTALTCARARRVLAISQSTANDLTAHLGVPADKIDVTPLGYDRAVISSPAGKGQWRIFAASTGLPERFWLFVGTLEPRKNSAAAAKSLRAAAECEDRLPLLLGGGIGWMAQEVFAVIEATWNWASG